MVGGEKKVSQKWSSGILFFSTFPKIVGGGSVIKQIKKVWPYYVLCGAGPSDGCDAVRELDFMRLMKSKMVQMDIKR